MQQPGPSRLHAEISARRQKQPPDVPRYLECCEPALAATIWRRRGAGTGMPVFGDSDDDFKSFAAASFGSPASDRSRCACPASLSLHPSIVALEEREKDMTYSVPAASDEGSFACRICRSSLASPRPSPGSVQPPAMHSLASNTDDAEDSSIGNDSSNATSSEEELCVAPPLAITYVRSVRVRARVCVSEWGISLRPLARHPQSNQCTSSFKTPGAGTLIGPRGTHAAIGRSELDSLREQIDDAIGSHDAGEVIAEPTACWIPGCLPRPWLR